MIHPSAGGKKHWLLIVDEATDYTHSFFLKKKSDLVETTIIWIKNLFMKYHIRIKKIRLDKSDENRMLQAKTREENLGSTRSQTLEMRSPSNHAMERANISIDNWIQETCYMSAVTSGPDEPNNFNEAWNHQCPNERGKWREAINKRVILYGKQKSLESHT